MNRWLQTKIFTCKQCGDKYLHDRGYFHECFLCPRRRDGVKTLAGQRPENTGASGEKMALTIKKTNRLILNEFTKSFGSGVPSFLLGMG